MEREFKEELELYTQTPEIHPDYEEKLILFKKFYRVRYGSKQEDEEFETQWKAFWRKGITQILRKEYSMRKKALDLEHSGKLERQAEEILKYKSPEGPSKAQKTLAAGENDHSPRNSNELPVGDKDLFVEESLRLLKEVAPFLGELSSSVQCLLKKINDCSSDYGKICKIFETEENRSILKEVSQKSKELAEVKEESWSEKQVLKFQLVSIQTLKLLKWALSYEKPKHFGLDIENIARLTYNKNPAYIIQTIKDLLSFKDINETSKEDISEIYKDVLSAHVDISLEDSGKDLEGSDKGVKRHSCERENISAPKKLCLGE